MCSRRVIVAGASGFLGRACVASLLEKGYFVEGLCRERPSEYIKHEKLQMHCEKEWSPGVLHKILLESYAVVNAAGLAHAHVSTQSLLFFESNAQLASSLFVAAIAAKAAVFVHLGSVAVYGLSKSGEESELCQPLNEYGSSKLVGERLLENLVSHDSPNLFVLRLAAVYGAGDRGNIARLISVIEKRRFVMIGKGGNRKSLVHKTDVGRAVACAIEKGSGIKFSGQANIFNVTGDSVAVHSLVSAIATTVGHSGAWITCPVWVAVMCARVLDVIMKTFGLDADYTRQVKKFISEDVVSGKKAADELGWEPKVSVSSGICEAITGRFGDV